MGSVAVLASHPLFRAGLRGLLHAMGFDPVKVAGDAKELRRQLDEDEHIRPELLLIDLSDTGISESNVRDWAPITKVVLLAADLDLGLLSEYFAAGASGYLLKNISADAFRESIRLVLAGEKVLPSGLATVIHRISVSWRPTAKRGGFDKLSNREIDILRGLATGQSNKVIADTRGIAESTVKVHVKRILHKIHVSNRTQAALWGAARGLAAPRTEEDRTERSLLQTA
ncbi:MAG TPA: response regulator transcription factor [Stellaceae bacterium]|nr:response regulator transcription factor [Stellaceae bacterium]